MGNGHLSGRPVSIESRPVCQVDIEPAIIVVIEKGEAAALRFNDVAFAIDATPDIWRVQSGSAANVYEYNGKWRDSRRFGLENQTTVPLPKR